MLSKCVVVLGEGESYRSYEDRVLSMLSTSGQFRSVHICASNISNATRCPQCTDWVRLAFDIRNPCSYESPAPS
jgi:hypothetical protein